MTYDEHTDSVYTSNRVSDLTFYAEAEIYNIGVGEAFRRRGIGQALLDAILEACLKRRVRRVWLEVRRSNIPAVKFYEINGFEEVYRRKNFYRHPDEDASVLVLDTECGRPVRARRLKT